MLIIIVIIIIAILGSCPFFLHFTSFSSVLVLLRILASLADHCRLRKQLSSNISEFQWLEGVIPVTNVAFMLSVFYRAKMGLSLQKYFAEILC